MTQLLSPLQLDQQTSLPRAFYALAEAAPENCIYQQAVRESKDSRLLLRRSAREVRSRVNRIAAYLRSLGVGRGSKVAIVSNTRAEWLEADMAILSLGAVVVAVYQSLPAHDVGYILYDSGAKIVFAENQEQVAKLFHLLSEDCPIAATEERAATRARIAIDKIISIESVENHEKVVGLETILQAEDPGSPSEINNITRADLATLVYTSGTTGPPKGVMQTHGNHLSNVRQAFQAGMFRVDTKIFLLLPLAHSFAKLMGYIGMITAAQVSLPAVSDKLSSKADPASVSRDMRESSAELIPLVPRLLEKMREGVLAKAHGGGTTAFILKLAVRSAQEVYSAKRAGKVAAPLSVLAAFFTRGIRRKIIRKLFGAHFRCVISGGAKLPSEVGHFFLSLGATVLEGYGLTETCVATNVNRFGDNRIGTVGPVLAPDIEIKISPEKEILFRGPNITLGYFNRPTATAAAWDAQGWFHTGDLGELDADGFLSIVGRRKEIIVTSNGKKITPDSVEQMVKRSPYVSQVYLYGDERPHCVALLVLNLAALAEWARRQSIELQTPPSTDLRVQALLQKEIDSVNASLAGFEQIRKFAVLDQEFTIDNGLLTPTFKTKRKEVARVYKDKLAELYF